jgi:HlyD family secretion protein
MYQKYKMTKKKILLVILIISCLLASIFLINKYLIPSFVKTDDYVTSLVDYGPVFTSVPASGIVNPENEVLLLSPSSSLVYSLTESPGSHVSKGSVILTLDPKSLIQEIDNLKDQLGVMTNNLQKNRLNARMIRVDLNYNVEVKKLKITSLKTKIKDQEQLLIVGGISSAIIEQTKGELVLAEKDLKMTLEKNTIRLKQIEADEKGLQLQIDMKDKALELKQDLLEKLTVRASSDGIILGIYTNVGEKVEKDKLLVKMSDLSTFKVKATVDNSYIDFVKTGIEVYAIIDDTSLKGKIGSVTPVMKDKKIEFDVFLDFGQNQKLIPNMEIELQIITQRRDSVLRFKRGPDFNKNRSTDFFVIKTGKAVREAVAVGLVGTKYVEIVSGLNQGDSVIISNISRSRHKREIVFEDF